MRKAEDILFKTLFTRNFTNRSFLDMDVNKNDIRLELDKDEIARLTTKIYHESGYSLDHDDPLIVQYLIHKIALAQFTENQGKIMTAFGDSLLPYIRDTEEQFEKKKVEFVNHLESVHRESLQKMNDQYLAMVNGTLNQVGQTVANQMDNIIKYMRGEGNSISRMMEQEHGKFRRTVERFENVMWKAAYIVGGSIGVSALVVAAVLYLR